MTTFLKILFVIAFSFFSTKVFLLLVAHSSAISTHPYIGIFARVIFVTILLSSFILRKKEIVLYSFLLSFPFLEIGFYGMNLFVIFTILLGVIYCKEIRFDLSQRKRFSYIFLTFLFFGSILCSTLLAPFKAEAFRWGIIFFVSSILFYLVLQVHLKTEIDFKKIWLCMFLVFCLCSFVSVYQMVFGIGSIRFFFGQYNTNTDMFGPERRIPSIFMDAQIAGQYFAVMSLALSGYAALRLRFSLLARGLSFIAMGGLLLTISRSAIIGFFVGWFLMQIFTKGRRAIFWGMGLLSVFLLVKEPLYQFVVPDSIKARFSEYQEKKSADYRLGLWERSFPIALHNPLGVGMGGVNLYNAGAKVRAEFNNYVTLKASNRAATTFESSYLDLLYSLGFVGLGTFIWLIGMYFIQWSWDMSKLQEPFKKASFYFLGAFCAWLIAALTSPLLFKTQSVLILILIMVSIQFIISWKKKDEIVRHNRLL